MTQERYDSTAIHLHWILAILIGAQFAFGLLLDKWPNATKLYYVNLHFMSGFLILALLLVRLGWRATHTPPPLPDDVDAFSRKASTPTHWLMYLILLALPVAGVIAAVWHARVFNFGLFAIDFGVKNNRAVYPLFEDIHGYLAYAIIGLACLHALAALWHHFIRRDGVLLRMWPGSRA